MPRLPATLLLIGLLLPAPVVAQDAGATAPLRDCRALLKSARGEIDRTPATIIEDVSGGCRFTNVHLMMDTYFAFSVDDFTLLSPGLLETFPTGEVFASADFDLEGITLPDGDKLDIRLIYSSDPEALTSRLEYFSVDAGKRGGFELKAYVSEFDNADIDAMRLGEDAGLLHEFDLSIRDNGFLGAYFASTAVDILMNKIAISTSVRALPDSMISMVSAESIVRFVTAMPEPRGYWSFRFESEQGLPIADLRASLFTDLENRLPADAKISATADYRP